MASVATDLIAAPECNRAEFAGAHRAVGLGAGQWRAFVVCAVAGAAFGSVIAALFEDVIMAIRPAPRCARADWMHPVWALIDGAGLGRMTTVAFHEHAGVALVLLAGHVVAGEGSGKLRVGRTMAARAFNTAVAGGEAIEGEVRGGHVRRGREQVGSGHIDAGVAHYAIGEDGSVADLAAVVDGVAGVASLAIGLFQPAGAAGAAHGAHVAVTTLTLHGHGAVGRINRLAHRAPEAPGDRPGMTGV